MSEENKQESGGLTSALPVTVVLAMLAGLIFTHSLPYKDERPSTHPVQARYAYAQDVDARLWQDPFAAVDDASEEKVSIEVNQNAETQRLTAARTADNSSSHRRDQIYKGGMIAARDEITILAVTLPGSPYQEAAEQRMRWRYAVLSALANQNITPQDGQHIGYFRPDSKPEMGLQKRVPFEWWSDPNTKQKVLLLWVDESSLLKYPAAKLKELLHQASPNPPEKLPKEIVFHYDVIGPNTSTLLRDMLKEVAEENKKNDSVSKCSDNPDANSTLSALGSINNHEIVYFSAAATASDLRLLQNTMPTECKTISGYLRRQGITLYRTTATDDAMMNVLADELKLRRINKTDHIVILSEWDTFYGQIMPEAFKDAWRNHDMIQDKSREQVHVYGYMRGLDGKLPEQGDKAGSPAERKAESKDKRVADALIEFPEGQSQKDYLRRLTDSVLELDQYLKDDRDGDGNPKGVVAFGVLGSDVHDKLMILEALRQYFPHQLFFTTDLDAAFIHPAKWHQTHNMLMASAYDLELRHELQDKIPPFRESYQTALFLAAQMAIKMELMNDKSIVGQIGIPGPRLFEIGRSRPAPLPTSPLSLPISKDKSSLYDTKPECAWSNWSECNSNVQPARSLSENADEELTVPFSFHGITPNRPTIILKHAIQTICYGIMATNNVIWSYDVSTFQIKPN